MSLIKVDHLFSFQEKISSLTYIEIEKEVDMTCAEQPNLYYLELPTLYIRRVALNWKIKTVAHEIQ